MDDSKPNLPPTPNETSSSSSSSWYTYPIRSLLTGRSPHPVVKEDDDSENQKVDVQKWTRSVNSAIDEERGGGRDKVENIEEEREREEREPTETFELQTEFFNPSEYGLVHLPPLPPQPSSSSRSHSILGYSPGGESREDGSIWGGKVHSDHSTIYASAMNSSEESVALVNFRFEHKENEDGHHVILKRGGKLTRCEDEPIRTPGAVQGFGVLIVVDEGEDSQFLVVRQVSENSGEILGLTPKYLFSLDCFTDILSDSQAECLWDNIQSLSDLNHNSEEKSGTPHVFTLSGYRQPGIAPDASIVGREENKRMWTCWCAIHRPSVASDSQDSSPNLIIMEFELEKDMLNPLYPPIPSQSATGEQSPGSSGLEGSRSSDSSTIGDEGGSGGSGSLGMDSSAGSGTTLVAHALGAVATIAMLDLEAALATETSKESMATHELAVGSVPVQADTPSGTTILTIPSSPDTNSPPVDTRTVMSRLEYTIQQQVEEYAASLEHISQSTTSRSKPLLALERVRRMGKAPEPQSDFSLSVEDGGGGRGKRSRRYPGTNIRTGVGMMDVLAVMGDINEQLDSAPNLDLFLKVTVGLLKDLTQFHRVLIYQFDDMWHGEVVAELVDRSQTQDLYQGLHFPASDIPAQARQLYAINKVRLLYDRSQPTARIVCRNKEDLDNPLDMTHCFLRAMSPIHVKYLENMGVRASMSVSIMSFGALWGLAMCHSYGDHGMRASFPVRQMLPLLSQSISKNMERLSHAQPLLTRELISTLTAENHPTGYIFSNADDLLGLFDAHFGILVIGEGAKILGPSILGQEILIIAEYLRLKRFGNIQASQAVKTDYPDLNPSGLRIIAGLLYVPLSDGGEDFIAFLRKGALRDVRWAGKPKDNLDEITKLEPRKSFEAWSETLVGRCKRWTDEQLEAAGVLAVLYGKFIEIRRQKENTARATRLTNLLLSNASHEVRTPLNHIINYLEMALNTPLDDETRENLKRSHAASKTLLFTINDLLDLTRLESGNETSFNESFDLRATITDAISVYQHEATRRGIDLQISISQSPVMVLGDSRKIKRIIQNLTANSLKYTQKGSIKVSCTTFGEPDGLRSNSTAVEIVVMDTGCGITPERLEIIFREIEQVEATSPKSSTDVGIGLGLAVVARIVEQLGGQLRVDSKVGEGSRFSLLIPLALSDIASPDKARLSIHSNTSSCLPAPVTPALLPQCEQSDERWTSGGACATEVDISVEAVGQGHLPSPNLTNTIPVACTAAVPGSLKVKDPGAPPRPTEVENTDIDTRLWSSHLHHPEQQSMPRNVKLRVLVVDDDDINRTILARRLRMDGHTVVNTTNGQEGLDMVKQDAEFDCVLMDIQMPILNGFEATVRIRAYEIESTNNAPLTERLSQTLNGRIPIFAVTASLREQQREELLSYGIDGWILKPINFKRLSTILSGIVDPLQHERDVYRPGCIWEVGGWLTEHLPLKMTSPDISSTQRE